jgi:hypothetical protein
MAKVEKRTKRAKFKNLEAKWVYFGYFLKKNVRNLKDINIFFNMHKCADIFINSERAINLQSNGI